ncbi:hypothetical protein P0Y35_05895 [Kiritimatiellaeota bacterium B1221]|nr:hypothetical protein [Kiritimatiellaeota bacterium B1221]
MPTNANPEIYLKGARGIATAANVSNRTAQNWMSSGRLPVKRLTPRLVLVKVTDLQAFIDAEAERYEEARA